jgi:hypothetical protein
MGTTTDFIGHINIDPPLNDAEENYLMAFAASRRYARPGGPYDVPRNPAADHDAPVADLDAYNTIAPGQPSLWCQWNPCWDGCCLSYDGTEKFYGAAKWMDYLIEHFLTPGAYAESSKLDWFDEFTFDHTLDGIIAASNRGSRELYLIRVEENEVWKETLVPPDARYYGFGPLPYETAIDQQRTQRRRPRPARRVG